MLHSGVDSNVRMVARWLVTHGHTVHILYNRGLPPDRDEHPLLHFHAATPGLIHYYLDRLGLRWRGIPSIIRHREDSLANARLLQRINQTQGLDLAELNEQNFHYREVGKLPFVYKMHGADWLFSRYVEDQQYNLAQIPPPGKMMWAAQQVHVVSRNEKDFVAGACDFPPRLIEVTPNPIYTSIFCPAAPPPPGPPYRITSVGRIEPRKGHHILVAAMRKVWESEPETHLYLLKGPSNQGAADLEKIVPDHQGRLHLVGFISEESLIEHYQQSHVYVTSARYETFGYTILEAMSCGRPVIGTDIGPIPELVRHEETGWLFPRDDVDALARTIVEALHNPTAREAYGLAARQLAERFDIEPLMQRQLKLYQHAIDTFKRRDVQ